MNCDRVFVVLTRGPFPTGEPSLDQGVESHLLACPECRRLAEALRPAVELYPEMVTLEESRELPGYWGQLQGSVIDQAISCIESRGDCAGPSSVQPAEAPPTARWTNTKPWRLAMALALGASLGAVLRYWDNAALRPSGAAAPQPMSATAEQDPSHGPTAVSPALNR